MQKGFASVLVLIGILVLTAVAGGAYYLGKSQVTKPQPQNPVVVSPTPDETANWKTYTSQYGYSFKYPESWGATESVGDEGVVIYSKPEYIQLIQQLEQGFDKEDYATVEVGMYLKGQQVADNSLGSNSNQIISPDTDVKDFVSRLYFSIIQSKEDTTFNGKPAVSVTFKRMVPPPGVALGSQDPPIQDGTTKSVWTKYNGNILFINYQYGRKYMNSNALPIIFDQILSTFKFTH
ncbi:hypothetical protein HY383_01275 [Candidatus Daviesbacteria bacterium]|nr:hypothetical protein [Candidatus Daviesbacteria bacterium]